MIIKTIFDSGKDRVFLITFFAVAFITIYRNSSLPGAYSFISSPNYLLSFIFLFAFLFMLNINNLLNFKMKTIFNSFILNLLMFIGLLSVFINIDIEFVDFYAVNRFLVFIFFIIFFGIIVPKLIDNNNDYFDLIIKFYFWLGTLIAIIGLIFMALGIAPTEKFPSAARFVSLATHPNKVSILVTITTIITLYYYFSQKPNLSFISKIFVLGSFFLQILSQFLTFSRGGILGTLVGIFLLLFFKYRLKFFLILPVILSIGFYFVMEIFVSKGTGSTLARLILLLPVYDMLMKFDIHTFFGYGITNSLNVFDSYRQQLGIVEVTSAPHNSFLSMFIMFGLIFTVIFLVFFVYCIYIGIRCSFKSKTPEKKFYYGFLVSLMVGIFVNAFFESTLVMPEYFQLPVFLLCIGIIYRSYYNLKQNDQALKLFHVPDFNS